MEMRRWTAPVNFANAYPDVLLLQRHGHRCADDLLTGLSADTLLAEVIKNNVGRCLTLAEARDGGLAVSNACKSITLLLNTATCGAERDLLE